MSSSPLSFVCIVMVRAFIVNMFVLIVYNIGECMV